ncbi:MAG: hypothetical protein NT062_29935 [Proteobacteria bacterium]|nr:hypothetical protein [Pseudomonadota bacterium]
MKPYSVVVYAGEGHAAMLCRALPRPCVRVTSRAQLFVETARRGGKVLAFVDADLLLPLDGELLDVPVVALIDVPTKDTLSTSVRTLAAFPWLSHCIAVSLLASPAARSHLQTFIDRLFEGDQPILGTGGIGRVARLARASRRETRFESMHGFFARHGLTSRAITAISDVSEELVMNALYDAPFEAGYFPEAVSRTEDIELPADRACEISYGIEDGTVFVRLCDPFGALTRARLFDVLNRCNSTSVTLDESRGGAGLGLWRIFSTAASVSITVIPGKLTDILIEIATRNGSIVRQLGAVHLYLATKLDWLDALAIPDERGFDQSISLVQVA